MADVSDLGPLVGYFVRRWKGYAAGLDRGDLWQTVWVAVLEAKRRHEQRQSTPLTSTLAAFYVRWRVTEWVRNERSHGAGTSRDQLPAREGRREAVYSSPPDTWLDAAERLTGLEMAVVKARLLDGRGFREIGREFRVNAHRVWAAAMDKLREGNPVAYRKPDPRPSDKIEFHGELVATVEWGPDGVRPDVMPWNPECVPPHCRPEVAEWLVKAAERRGVELTPAEARRLIFGDG